MSWSWRIGRLAGIPIFVHWTFLILIAWVAFEELRRGNDPRAAAASVAFVLALFGCVVLHELGHALAARRFGVPTADITLLPIGGVARLQRIPEKPAQELAIAVAGPAVNLAIVVALLAIGVRLPGAASKARDVFELPFLSNLLLVNLSLMLFNLLPAFPMDGGRILRALLATRMEYPRATRLAARVGGFVAIIFVFLGLSGWNPMLFLIAMFVWIGAEGEAAQVEERYLLRGTRVRSAMLTDFRALRPDDTLGAAAELLLAGSQQDFPVLDGDRVVGLLTRSGLLAGLSRAGRDGLVSEFLRPEVEAVQADSPLVPALARLRGGEGPCLMVMDGDQPSGLLTLENLGEYVAVRLALGGEPGAAPVAAGVASGSAR